MSEESAWIAYREAKIIARQAYDDALVMAGKAYEEASNKAVEAYEKERGESNGKTYCLLSRP